MDGKLTDTQAFEKLREEVLFFKGERDALLSAFKTCKELSAPFESKEVEFSPSFKDVSLTAIHDLAVLMLDAHTPLIPPQKRGVGGHFFKGSGWCVECGYHRTEHFSMRQSKKVFNLNRKIDELYHTINELHQQIETWRKRWKTATETLRSIDHLAGEHLKTKDLDLDENGLPLAQYKGL